MMADPTPETVTIYGVERYDSAFPTLLTEMEGKIFAPRTERLQSSVVEQHTF